MHAMRTILTDVYDVRQSVCLSRGLNWQRCMQCTLRVIMCSHSVQPLPNAFGLLFIVVHTLLLMLVVVYLWLAAWRNG